MAYTIPRKMGVGGQHIQDLWKALEAVQDDLTALKAVAEAVPENIKTSLVNGTTATTNIAVTGIVTTDKLLRVLHFTSGALTADLTSEASITSNGNIQLGSTDTSGDQLLVEWFDKPAAITLNLQKAS